MTGPSAPPLIDRVRGLVHRACQIYGGGPALPDLQRAAARLDEPLRVALAGRVKAGKSTLLNALVGQELAATDAGECTRIVTWFRDGHTYRVTAHPRQGPARPLAPGPTGGLLDIDLGGMRPEDVDRLVVDWPSPTLRTMTLIDTPGLGSLTTELSRRTEAALGTDGDEEAGGRASEADAVVYLMRHVHAADVRFLEAFRDDPAERRPINTLGVLARADEVGHGRPDALESAARIAVRYRDDARVRALCQTVVPVAGLLAVSAATLREEEFRAVAVLAGLPETDLATLLLSAGRFVSTDLADGPGPGLRSALLDRYGLFGLRLSVRLVQSGVATTAGALSRELLARSGLSPLRDALVHRFAARADVLKARSALLALEGTLRRYPFPAADGLRHELEMINSSAHEFAEVRLLDTLRGGGLMLTPQERGDAERLLGIDGVAPLTRLGVAEGSPRPDVVKAAQATLSQWKRRAEHPSSARDVREAARVLVRTAEGLLLELVRPDRPPAPGPSAAPPWPRVGAP